MLNKQYIKVIHQTGNAQVNDHSSPALVKIVNTCMAADSVNT